jgi:hypothetical protein
MASFISAEKAPSNSKLTTAFPAVSLITILFKCACPAYAVFWMRMSTPTHMRIFLTLLDIFK